jgi:alkanesulfonate monooxygenase SsuD/methylene tetrahydromethanopterin reductase-like flavin-dependent oxidoreductase (luciferase family)
MAISILRFDMRSPAFSPAQTGELYAAALEMCSWAEEQGFDVVVVSEHHAVEDGFLPSPVALMGAMVGRTRTLRVSASALLLPLYDPVKLAEDLVVLDLASGGRVSVTVGIGYRPVEFAMFGKDWNARGKLMDECLDVVLRAWSGEPFEWNGRRVHMTTAPLTRPKPPIFVGGMGKLGARRAARFGLPFQPAVSDPEVLELYRSECERLGVENPLLMPPGSGEMVWVSRDPDRTWNQIGSYLLHDATTYHSWQPAHQHSAVHSTASTIDELRVEGKYRILTPEQCVERAEKLGPLGDFGLFPLCGGTPPELAWESLELYANEVLPAIRSGSGT